MERSMRAAQSAKLRFVMGKTMIVMGRSMRAAPFVNPRLKSVMGKIMIATG
jgi:hypothetical protein